MGGWPQEELVAVCGLITRQHVGVCGYATDRGLVGVLVVCILCLKFGIQTAHGVVPWWMCGLATGLVGGHRVPPHDEQGPFRHVVWKVTGWPRNELFGVACGLVILS